MELQTNQSGEPWLTKAQAAQRLGVSERTIENYAADHRIGSREEQMQGRKARPMFDPDDIARLAAEKNKGAIQTGNPQEQFGQLATGGAMVAIARIADAMTSRPAPPRLFMHLQEAEAYSGLPQGLLRKLIRQGKLPSATFRSSTWIKTSDLENVTFASWSADSAMRSESLRNDA